ncbi:hypothetical protein FSARC_13395 [Fusarium sarcochroum]|uniref:JmjC domain-containing protein n=1 Tax=Fusarium sarcochroum TaxID=1208366 RepID=A0A8H4T1P4_9HYPO|nr:hypothetical protein FSARC_13395 [Fusarium sarcochroum]
MPSCEQKRLFSSFAAVAFSPFRSDHLTKSGEQSALEKAANISSGRYQPAAVREEQSTTSHEHHIGDEQSPTDTQRESETSDSESLATGNKGHVTVSTSESKPPIDWPQSIAKCKRPTIAEATRFFEDTIQQPPLRIIPYYVGRANIPHLTPLDPGPLVTEDSDYTDIHREYHHLGPHLSGNRMHCEDNTYREQIDGKTLKIAIHHIEKFDEFIKANWRGKDCNQAVGHQNLLIPPSMLNAEGIDYQVSVIRCGEAESTEPGQQHQIINYGYCAARSMNYLNPDDLFDPKLATHCSQCGLQPHAQENDASVDTTPSEVAPEQVASIRKRKADSQLSTVPSKTTRVRILN